MEDDQSKRPTDDVKSRVDSSVPQPPPTKDMSEDEKRALELQGEVEHAMGERREEIAERAQEKGSGNK